jgi:hypothetical protein
MPRGDRIAEFQEVIVRQPTAEEGQAWSGLVTA